MSVTLENLFSAWVQKRKSLHSGGSPQLSLRCPWCWDLLRGWGLEAPAVLWAQKQFCKQPHHYTVVTHYKYCAKWASTRLASYNKKMALPQFKDDSAMANQSSHAWVTSTGSRFRVLWKYMHSEVLWIIPNNSEYLFCYTNESKPSLPHYLQSSWRKWISVYSFCINSAPPAHSLSSACLHNNNNNRDVQLAHRPIKKSSAWD